MILTGHLIPIGTAEHRRVDLLSRLSMAPLDSSTEFVSRSIKRAQRVTMSFERSLAKVVKHLHSVRAAIGRLLCRLTQNPRLYRSGRGSWCASFMPRVQSDHALLFEAFFPASNRRARGMQLHLNLIPAFSIGQCQHEAGPKDITRRKRSRLCPVEQLFAILRGQLRHSMIASHIIKTALKPVGNEIAGTAH